MSLVSIPELENNCKYWVVSYKNDDVLNSFTDVRAVGSFAKEEFFVETAFKFLSKVDERIFFKLKEIERLRTIKQSLLQDNENKKHYETLLHNQLISFKEENRLQKLKESALNKLSYEEQVALGLVK